MSGAWSKGASKAVAEAPPPGAMAQPATAGGGRGGGRGRHNNSSRGGGRGGRGRSGGGRDNQRGGGGGRHHGGGRGRGGGRHNNNNNGGQHKTDRITIKDVQLLEEAGVGNSKAQQSVIRIPARELVRQRLQYTERKEGDEFTPNPQCHWTAADRLEIIQALCSKVMELGDVSKYEGSSTKPAKHETAPALEDCKPLEKNEEKRWKSKAMELQSSLITEKPPEPETKEEIVARARLILNKVSWTTLPKLTQQFMEITNLKENQEIRQEIIPLLVEKAQLEPHFADMYAEICALIAKQVKTFKKELLTECQKEFEVDLDHQIANACAGKTDPDEIEYESLLIRKAYIGHMKFLGELYLRDVVKLAIMLYCLDELLKDDTHEDSLECFATIMTTTGEKLDGHAQQNDKSFDWQRVVDLRNSSKISNRIKFLLQDLLDLRMRGWVQRRKTESATTLAAIHKEVAKEEQQARRASNTSQSGGNQPPRRASQPNLRRSTSQPQVDNDGFTSIQKVAFRKTTSKSSLGPPMSPPSPNKAPAMSSLRRAISQPAMPQGANSGPPPSPMDAKKIASSFGVLSMDDDDDDDGPGLPSMDEEVSSQPTVDPETCSKKMQSILKEYYVGGDTEDAILSVQELVQVGTKDATARGAKVFEGATLLAMEGKPTDLDKMLSVLKLCIADEKNIPHASIIAGLQDPLEFLADIEIDAPLAGKHLAQIVLVCLTAAAKNLTLQALLVDESPEYFRTGGKAAGFACQVLKASAKDPSESDLQVVESLMTADEKKEYASGKAMWQAKSK